MLNYNVVTAETTSGQVSLNGYLLQGSGIYELVSKLYEVAQATDEAFAESARAAILKKTEVQVLREALTKLSQVDDSQRFNRCALATQALLDADLVTGAKKMPEPTTKELLKKIEDSWHEDYLEGPWT